LLLVVNGIGLIAGWRLMADFDENRDLAKAPQWSGSLPQFLRAFDAFVKDNFPLRKPFLLGYNSSLYHGFASSSNSRVIIGRNGWIFGAEYDSADGTIASRTLTADYLHRLRIALEERRDWLAEQGIFFLFMFYPTKTTVYGGKYLPGHMQLDSGYESTGRQVARSLGPELAANFVEIEQPLREAAARSDDYYYFTDTHATHEGAFLAVERLRQQLQTHHAQVPLAPYPASETKLDLLSPTAFGRTMGVPFKELSKVRVPLGGFNTGLAEIPPDIAPLVADQPRSLHFVNPKLSGSRLVLIGDSFINRMNYFMGESFAEVIAINLNDSPPTPEGKFPIEVIRTFKPDVVVVAYVESRLVESAEEIARDVVPLLNPPEVRQARLRRLFANAPEPAETVRFEPFATDNGKTAFVVTPTGTMPAQGHLLLHLEYRGEKTIALYWDYPPGALPGEIREIRLGPECRSAFLFLPRTKTGALDVLRTDQREIDPSLLSGQGAWLQVKDL